MSDDWLGRALSSHKRGDHAATLRACADAPADPQSQIRAHSVRASALARLGRAPDALDEIRAALHLGARSTELFHLAAKVCAAQGELASARDWFDRALTETPGSQRTLERREKVVIDMHLLSGLHDHMELAVALQPTNLEAREKLITSCLRLGLLDMAGEHLDAALAQNPRHAPLHISKAIVCVGTGRPQAAVEALEQALALDVAMADRLRIGVLFIKAGALERALRTAHESRALAPDAPEVRLQDGFFALWQGDIRTAAGVCSGLVEGTPGRARLGAAIAFVEDRPEVALAMATEAFAQDHTDAAAHALRAGALLHLARYAEAEAGARNAAHATPEWVPAAQLIEAAARAGQYPTIKRFEVAELFELLAALWPEPVVIPGTHADVASKPVFDTLDAGLRRLFGNLTSAPTFLPQGTGTWSSFSARPPARTACVRVFDFMQARPLAWVAERMAALAAVYPRSPYVHTHTAELRLWNGEYAACEAECRKALALTKTEGSRWAWVGLGAALMLQGRHPEALDVFAESERLTAPGAPLLAYRGETLRRCGQLDAAQQDLTRSLALSPTRVSAWLNLGLIASARGHDDELRDIYRRLRAHEPQLLGDVEREMPVDAGADTRGSDVMAATLEHALRVMRGNRSSHRVTYVLEDGLARVLPARALTPR